MEDTKAGLFQRYEALSLSTKLGLIVSFVAVGLVLAYVWLLPKPLERDLQQQQLQMQKRLDYLLSLPDTRQYAWMRTLNPKAQNIKGSLIWNPEHQQGMMTFQGLPAIDDDQRYRLWVYDRNQADDSPIDAGQFGKTNGMPRDLLVMMQPTEQVASPYKFLLTLEAMNGSGEVQNLLRAQP